MSGLELPHNIGDIIGARNASKRVTAKATLKILFCSTLPDVGLLGLE